MDTSEVVNVMTKYPRKQEHYHSRNTTDFGTYQGNTNQHQIHTTYILFGEKDFFIQNFKKPLKSWAFLLQNTPKKGHRKS